MHTGLILASKSASELADVIAHEIGHVTARPRGAAVPPLAQPDNLRHDDLGRLPIIQERIRLLSGTDSDVALESL